MKKGIIYSLITVLVAFMASCSPKIQTYDLNEEYATSLHIQPIESTGEELAADDEGENAGLVGVPYRNFYGGDLKRGGIWWASKGVTIAKGDTFNISVTHIGGDSTPLGATNPAIDLPTTPFGANFSPVDMATEPVAIKISARAQGENGATPILHVEAVDMNGNKADAKRPAQTIQNSPEFVDYYFDMKDVFYQNEPKKKVNGTMISSIKFYITPGYTGEIYIREIKIVPNSAIPKP
jgi:hypothetical protein